MLKWLGVFAKGKATVVGLAVLVLSTLGQTDAAEKVAPVADAVLNIAQAVGAALAIFGIGRKSGYSATG